MLCIKPIKLILVSFISIISITRAAPPNIDIPISRLHSDLTPVNSNTHRAINVLVGTPPQALQLILDTGSADLLIFNASYCRTATGAATAINRACFDARQTDYTKSFYDWSSSFDIEYINDGEHLCDPSAQRAGLVTNIPVNLTGTNTLIQIGRSQLTDPSRLSGYPSAGDQPVNAVISYPTVVYPTNVPTNPFPYLLNSWNLLDEIDGILGIGYKQLSRSLQQRSLANTNETAWDDLTRSIDPTLYQSPYQSNEPFVYSLDFVTNRLLYGGIDPTWENQIIWTQTATKQSVRQSNRQQLYSSFYVYDLSVCGKNLQTIYKKLPIESIIDTGSSCLTLPSELFDSLISWLPLTCSKDYDQSDDDDDDDDEDVTGGANNEPLTQPIVQNFNTNVRQNQRTRYCWLSVDQSVNQLPILSFRVNDDTPSQPLNQTIYLPLNDLLAPSRTSISQPQRLCVVRSTSLFDPVTPPMIIFGAKTLRSIHQVYVPDLFRIGMMNPRSIKQSIKQSNQSCVARVPCLGQQKLDPTYNICIDPDCNSYFFWTYNQSNNQCEISSSFHVILAIFIIVFIAGEMLFNEGVIHMAKKVQGIQGERRQARRR